MTYTECTYVTKQSARVSPVARIHDALVYTITVSLCCECQHSRSAGCVVCQHSRSAGCVVCQHSRSAGCVVCQHSRSAACVVLMAESQLVKFSHCWRGGEVIYFILIIHIQHAPLHSNTTRFTVKYSQYSYMYLHLCTIYSVLYS